MNAPKKQKKKTDEKGIRVSNCYVETTQLESKQEMRLVRLAIERSQNYEIGFDLDHPIRISAQEFAECFNLKIRNVYKEMRNCVSRLFRHTYQEKHVDADGHTWHVYMKWFRQMKYCETLGAVEVVFDDFHKKHLWRLNGHETPYTFTLMSSYIGLKTKHSIRIYEIIAKHKNMSSATITLDKLRQMLALSPRYRGTDFTTKILTPAIKNINESTEFDVSWEKVKEGRVLSGYKFTIRAKKPKALPSQKDDSKKDKTYPEHVRDHVLETTANRPGGPIDITKSAEQRSLENWLAWSIQERDRISKEFANYTKDKVFVRSSSN